MPTRVKELFPTLKRARSMSLKYDPTGNRTSVYRVRGGRSTTMPQPWSPGQFRSKRTNICCLEVSIKRQGRYMSVYNQHNGTSEQCWFHLSTTVPRSGYSESPPDISHERMTSPYFEYSTACSHRERVMDGILSPEDCPDMNPSPSLSSRDEEVMRRMTFGVTSPSRALISECRYGSSRLQDESPESSPYTDILTKITRLGRVGILETVEEDLEPSLYLDSSLSYVSSHGSTVSLKEMIRKEDVIDTNKTPIDQHIRSKNDGTKTTTRSRGKKKHKMSKCKGKEKEEIPGNPTLPPLKGVPRQPHSEHGHHVGSCVVQADIFNPYALPISEERLTSFHSRQGSESHISNMNSWQPNRDNAALPDILRPSTSQPRELQVCYNPRRSSSNYQSVGASSVPSLPPIRGTSINSRPNSALAQLDKSQFLPLHPTCQKGKLRPNRHSKGASKSRRKS